MRLVGTPVLERFRPCGHALLWWITFDYFTTRPLNPLLPHLQGVTTNLQRRFEPSQTLPSKGGPQGLRRLDTRNWTNVGASHALGGDACVGTLSSLQDTLYFGREHNPLITFI